MENTQFQLVAPCLFGVESVLKKEIKKLGYNISKVDDGRIVFDGDASAICRSNIWLRTAERILVQVGVFEAKDYETLFQNVKSIEWENYIPRDGKVWVAKASSIQSKLFSPSDIQSIIKKAIVERLKGVYKISWLEETGNEFPLRVFIKKDIVSIGLDTSGEALHKRGYREVGSEAPIRETLAAALVQLSNWNKDKVFADPFCGSGTLPIEAAMIGANIAPGLGREFISESWKHLIAPKMWMDAVDEANDLMDEDVQLNIQGFDKDFRLLKVARENAKIAGVDRFIHFQERDVADFSSNKKSGVMLTNPPYGERLLLEKDVIELYKILGGKFKALPGWSFFVITSFEDFERYFGKSADKKRKMYNGMIKTYLYQYYGDKK